MILQALLLVTKQSEPIKGLLTAVHSVVLSSTLQSPFTVQLLLKPYNPFYTGGLKKILIFCLFVSQNIFPCHNILS